METSKSAIRDEEQFFVKYFDQKKVREAFITKKRKALPEDLEEAEEEDFANDLFEKRMKDNDIDDDEDDEEIDDFLREEMGKLPLFDLIAPFVLFFFLKKTTSLITPSFSKI